MRFNTFIPTEMITAIPGLVEGLGDERGLDVNSQKVRTAQYVVFDYSTPKVNPFNYVGTSHQTLFGDPFKHARAGNEGMHALNGG